MASKVGESWTGVLTMLERGERIKLLGYGVDGGLPDSLATAARERNLLLAVWPFDPERPRDLLVWAVEKELTILKSGEVENRGREYEALE